MEIALQNDAVSKPVTAKTNNRGRTVGVYGEALMQFQLVQRGWIVDAIGATASGIDLLAWKEGGPNMGISVKTRVRNERGSITLFKNDVHAEAMREECRLRGVIPYIACVVFADRGNRTYLMSLDTFLSRYRRRPRVTTETIEFYRTEADEQKYDADSEVLKFHGVN